MADGIVKINYHGFWQNFDKENNLLINALRKNFDVEISDKPDFLFCSWFTDEPCKDEECIKIFYSYENRTMNMLLNGFHYAVGLKKVKFSNKNNRYLRHCICPDIPSEYRKNLPDSLAGRKFCNFIYSNTLRGDNVKNRELFCQKLMEYKSVDCPGIALNNTNPIGALDTPDWENVKINYQRNYKFSIAFENSIADGYSTEKINHPFMADSIPIYMGNPSIAEDYNPKAFINAADYKNFDEVIERIIELDNNDALYMQMLREPLYLKEPEYDRQLEEFLFNIVNAGNTKVTRLIKPFFSI